MYGFCSSFPPTLGQEWLYSIKNGWLNIRVPGACGRRVVSTIYHTCHKSFL